MKLIQYAVLVFAISVAWTISTQSYAAKLSVQQQATLANLVIPAYESGNGAGLLESVNKLVARLDGDEIAALDEHLQQQELPTLGAMLLDTRLAFLQNGVGFLKPKPLPMEVVLILPELHRRAETVIKEVEAMPVMSEALAAPQELQGYEELFYAIDQAQQQAGFATDVARQAVSLLRLARISRSKLSDEQRAALAADYDGLVQTLSELHQKTKERDIQLRLRRLDQAVTILEQSDDLKQRILAAHFVDYDGSTLTEVFKQQAEPRATPFISSSLNSPDLATQTEEQIERGRELAGDLMQKARLFFTGMHWWVRGRYGRGPLVYGMVKSEMALTSEAARLPVYMPYELPKDDQVSDYDYPDRRHYYTWLWEERTLIVISNSNSRPLNKPNGGVVTPEFKFPSQPKQQRRSKIVPIKGTRGLRFGNGFSGSRGGGGGGMKMQLGRDQYGPIDRPYSWTVADVYKKLGYDDVYKRMKEKSDYRPPRTPPKPTRETTTYIETYVPKQDPNLIYRIVGYIEYMNALECFDGLAKYCSEEELAAIDELIQERDEFAIEINLSRNVEHQPSQLEELRDKPNDDFRRRGLAWVAGLARAELAAMLVGFASQHDAFQHVAADYDRAAYKEIVQDGMRTHYWSLATDPDLQLIVAGEANVNRTLAYFRRLLVAEGFLNASAFLGAADFSPAQRQELLVWKENLDKLQGVIAKRIEGFHRKEVITQQR